MDDTAPALRHEGDGVPEAEPQQVIRPRSRHFNTAERRRIDNQRKRPPYIALAPGVRTRSNRLVAYVTVGGKAYSRYFPPDTDVATAQAWREHIRDAHGTARVSPFRRPLPKTSGGWCYVYFAQQGNAVKVGRATDVLRRIEELQTASALPVRLLVAVAAHHSLENEYIKRLQPFRLKGEWFLYGREIAAIVASLRDGMNPVELLFSWHLIVAPHDPQA